MKNIECIKDRRTGRSTARALLIIAASYNNPGIEFPIVDHIDTHMTNRNLTRTIQDMVKNLGLSGFIFDQHNNRILYQKLDNSRVIEEAKKYCSCNCPDCKKV